MAEETQYKSRNGISVISTANTNLDGTGALGTVIVAGSKGTLIKSIFIKAMTNTGNGMVRLFIDNGSNTRLFQEVSVPAVTKGSNTPAFGAVLELNLALASGFILKASTQNGDKFGIVAEAVDWSYYPSVRTDRTEFKALAGLADVITGNTNLDGTGTLALAYKDANTYGMSIESINIKALQSTTPGMIRIFLQNSAGSTTSLFKEIPVPAITCSGKVPAFEYTLDFEDDFELEANYSILVSTEQSESFRVFVDGLIRTYAP